MISEGDKGLPKIEPTVAVKDLRSISSMMEWVRIILPSPLQPSVFQSHSVDSLDKQLLVVFLNFLLGIDC